MEYKLYQLDLIKNNHNHFLHDCKIKAKDKNFQIMEV